MFIKKVFIKKVQKRLKNNYRPVSILQGTCRYIIILIIIFKYF